MTDVSLRVVDGECWAGAAQLLPSGRLDGGMTGFRTAEDGGFTLTDDGDVYVSCVTKTGGSGSGPRHTTAYCHGQAKTPCGANMESACKELPGCAWKPTNPSYRYFYCTAVRACREIEDQAGCSVFPGCVWSH